MVILWYNDMVHALECWLGWTLLKLFLPFIVSSTRISTPSIQTLPFYRFGVAPFVRTDDTATSRPLQTNYCTDNLLVMVLWALQPRTLIPQNVSSSPRAPPWKHPPIIAFVRYLISPWPSWRIDHDHLLQKMVRIAAYFRTVDRQSPLVVTAQSRLTIQYIHHIICSRRIPLPELVRFPTPPPEVSYSASSFRQRCGEGPTAWQATKKKQLADRGYRALPRTDQVDPKLWLQFCGNIFKIKLWLARWRHLKFKNWTTSLSY